MEIVSAKDRLLWPETLMFPEENECKIFATMHEDVNRLRKMILDSPAVIAPSCAEENLVQALRIGSYKCDKAVSLLRGFFTIRHEDGFPRRGSIPRAIIEYRGTESPFWPEIWSTSPENIEERLRIIKNQLQYLKNKISESFDLDVPTNDKFLLRFLRAQDYNQENAFRLVLNYFRIRAANPRIFKEFLPSKLPLTFSQPLLGITSRLDSQGRMICIVRPGMWDPSTLTTTECFRYWLMTLEASSFQELLQCHGIICILDVKGFGWHHLRHITMQDAKFLMYSFQDYVPLKIKFLYIINEPYLFKWFYRCCKMFINPILEDKIYFLGSSLDSLHKHISPEYLPSDYGGHLGSFTGEGLMSACLHLEEEFRKLLYIDQNLKL